MCIRIRSFEVARELDADGGIDKVGADIVDEGARRLNTLPGKERRHRFEETRNPLNLSDESAPFGLAYFPLNHWSDSGSICTVGLSDIHVKCRLSG